MFQFCVKVAYFCIIEKLKKDIYMNKKKIFVITLVAMLSASWNMAVSGTVYDEPQKMEQKKEMPNPEKAAKKRTDDMDKVLNLTEKTVQKDLQTLP